MRLQLWKLLAGAFIVGVASSIAATMLLPWEVERIGLLSHVFSVNSTIPSIIIGVCTGSFWVLGTLFLIAKAKPFNVLVVTLLVTVAMWFISGGSFPTEQGMVGQAISALALAGVAAPSLMLLVVRYTKNCSA